MSYIIAYMLECPKGHGRYKSPDSSVVEHLHGKQAVVGSIPILGSSLRKIIYELK